MAGDFALSDFGKYWDDLKKHEKRLEHWLPCIRDVFNRLAGQRPLRYFTLCARTMIDVFMLVRAKLVLYDPETHAIQGVQFCEYDEESFVAIRDLIARESSGFLGELEEILLFEDDAFTMQFPDEEHIQSALEDEAIAGGPQGKRLRLKRYNREFRGYFPFDYINLDFCEGYYEPPDILKVTKAIRRVLEWQRSSAADGVTVNEFVMAVTCRLDELLPIEAGNMLAKLVESNRTGSADYDSAFRRSRGSVTVDAWRTEEPNDFFLSAWPKDVASIAKDLNWRTEIVDYVYYDRIGDKGNHYLMICLIARFTKAAGFPSYMSAALSALDLDERSKIIDRPKHSAEREKLWKDLDEIVAVRNGQAQHFGRTDLLPSPGQ